MSLGTWVVASSHSQDPRWFLPTPLDRHLRPPPAHSGNFQSHQRQDHSGHRLTREHMGGWGPPEWPAALIREPQLRLWMGFRAKPVHSLETLVLLLGLGHGPARCEGI